jgi:hypothetical protein
MLFRYRRKKKNTGGLTQRWLETCGRESGLTVVMYAWACEED